MEPGNDSFGRVSGYPDVSPQCSMFKYMPFIISATVAWILSPNTVII